MSETFNREAVGRGTLIHGDCLEILPRLPAESVQLIIADPPYFQVLENAVWDNRWATEEDYLDWCLRWIKSAAKLLRPDGLFYIFGQLGKREHAWLHLCSRAAQSLQFHDMIIWDRAVGYNERSDSFTPQYEMILVLRRPDGTAPFFDKDAVRLPYDEATIQRYLRDPRYKDPVARERHLRKGKYATNILRVPSLKGASKEKCGHPSQKPLALIDMLVRSSSRPGDVVMDPFLGSGTTAAAAEANGRDWIGIESDPGYVAIIRERLIKFVSGNAELELPFA